MQREIEQKRITNADRISEYVPGGEKNNRLQLKYAQCG